MRYRLRTLLIVLAVLPPAGGIFWWYMVKAENPIVGVPLAFTFGALAAIVVTWLCELADFMGRFTANRRD
jgi:hypothetical protein